MDTTGTYHLSCWGLKGLIGIIWGWFDDDEKAGWGCNTLVQSEINFFVEKHSY